MGIPVINRKLQGYVEITVTGPGAVAFLQLAANEAIAVWQVRRRDGAVVCYVFAADFRRLRPLARCTGVRVRISGRYGLPFKVRGPAREAILSGIIVFVGLLYIMGAFVWTVELRGLDQIPQEEVVHSLRQAGLYAGSLKRNLDLHSIERVLLGEVQWLSWVGIELRGSVARVTLVEKEDPGALLETMEPADLVAAKAGFIETLIVLEGNARVREGAQVQEGDVLISGDPPHLHFHGRTVAPPDWPPAAVRARGIVFGRVIYRMEAQMPFVLETTERTGQTVQRSELHIGIRSLVLTGTAEEPPFELYEAERNSLVWRWCDSELLAELASVTYYEVERIREHLGPAGARAEAEAIARRDFGLMLTPGAVVVAQTVNARELPEGVAVELVVEVIEDIAKVRPR